MSLILEKLPPTQEIETKAVSEHHLQMGKNFLINYK